MLESGADVTTERGSNLISVHDGPFDPVSTWIHHEYTELAAAYVLRILARASIPVLAVKGFALARTLYDDVSERPMVDVDLRISPRHFRHAKLALRAAGLVLDRSSASLGCLGVHWRGVLVEIESHLGPPGVSRLSIEQLIECSSLYRQGTLEFRIPELHDHAIILCLNVFKDLLEVRPWAIQDLKRMGQHAQFSPTTLVDRARKAGVERIVYIVAQWLVREHMLYEWQQVVNLQGRTSNRPYDLAYEWARRSPLSPELRLLLTSVAADSLFRQFAGFLLACSGASLWKFRRTFRSERAPGHSSDP